MPPAPRLSKAQIDQLVHQAQEALRRQQINPAAQAVNRVFKQDPSHGEANHIASWLCLGMGERERALNHAKKAVKANPRDARYFGALGMAYTSLDQFEEAAAAHGHAVSLDPKFLPSLLNLVPALFQLEKFQDALSAIERAEKLAPDLADVQMNRGMVLVQMCRCDEAVASVERAIELNPSMAIAHEAACYTANYADNLTPGEVFAVHERAGRVIESQAPLLPAPTNDPTPDRPIRIGFLTRDFRRHSIAFFAENILEFLDRDRVVPVVFNLERNRDEVSDRLRSKSEWHECAKMFDPQLAKFVRDQKADILFELGGYTSGNKTPFMASKPAPLAVNYMGYPHSSGLTRITHRFIDQVSDPEGMTRATETLVRLPGCFLCYRPHDKAPDIALPDFHRPVVFGSFNDYKKSSPSTVRLWSKVLHAVPGSKLLLKSRSFANTGVREHAVAGFAAHGITEDRLEIHARIEDPAGHLGLYERLDIGLEPIPYHGTTTTCEAMWMGVPVVTLAGDRHAMRVGASLLTAVGLEELIAHDEDEYVRLCAGLAGDVDRRRELRTTMRDRLSASPLLDGPGFARRFEEALRSIWTEWCDGKGPGRELS